MSETTEVQSLTLYNGERPPRYWQTLLARRDKGIKLLNEERPSWLAKMNTDDLDLSDPRACVLGQAFMRRVVRCANDDSFSDYSNTGYEIGLKALFPEGASPYSTAKAVDYGFCSSEDWESYSKYGEGRDYSDCINTESEYEDLTAVWVMAIDKLKS